MRRLWLVFSQAVTVGVAGVFVLDTLQPQWWQGAGLSTRGPAVQVIQASAPASVPAGQAVSYALAARLAAPSVVSVMTTGAARPEAALKRFFSDPHGERGGEGEEGGTEGDGASGSGSGVIVSADGYLLTNHHVIAEARQIEVALADGRRLKARVIGTDPDSDLAVLKVDAQQLPAITFGRAEALQVGDGVLAIGNPFNVGQTVTAGIVSALGRSGLGLNTFENFIQTDAAINPGNSGGALVDGAGQLLGINTAIYSRSGGSMGIGFAIPATTASQVMEALIRDGAVTRGWIGVQPRDLSPDLAESMRLQTDRGVLIAGVLQGGPASAAGVLPGDVVVQVGERAVVNTAQLLNAVAALKPLSTVELSVWRGEQRLAIPIRIAQRPKAQAATTPR
jgi:serine protease DegQ